MKKDPREKKKSFREQWRDAFRNVTREEAKNVLKDTWKDWRKDPKEAGIFLATAFVPGGWIGYGVYRVEKYRRRKAANDNNPPSDARKPRPGKPGGPSV